MCPDTFCMITVILSSTVTQITAKPTTQKTICEPGTEEFGIAERLVLSDRTIHKYRMRLVPTLRCRIVHVYNGYEYLPYMCHVKHSRSIKRYQLETGRCNRLNFGDYHKNRCRHKALLSAYKLARSHCSKITSKSKTDESFEDFI